MKRDPVITSQIGGYLFEWEQDHLAVKCSRLNTHSDGRVTGELFISNNNKAKPIILLPATSFNFSSEPTRVKFAKQMQAKLASEINWIELFDYLGQKVQELARSGDLSEEVWAQDEIIIPEFLLNPLIIKGMSNIIFGEKGVNKSTFAYVAGAIVFLPWEDNPLELVPTERNIKTLVLDWETDRATFDYYLARLHRGMNIPAFFLNYRRCTLPLSEDIEAIEKELERTGAELLIIDSLAAAAGGEDNELKGSQSALRFNTALRKLGTTSLIIAQTSKSQQQERTHKKTIYGSTIFTYYARNIFELCHSEDEGGAIKHLALFHRECNVARKSAPMGFRLDFREDNSIAIEREPVSISEFSEKMNTQARILDTLKTGPLEVKDLAELLGITVSSVSMAMSRLKKKGQVVKVDKAFGLVSKITL